MGHVSQDPSVRHRESVRHSADTPLPLSPASRRLRALASLSGSLTDALTPQEAADLVEQKALAALGASSAVVVTLGAFPPPAGRPLAAEPDPDARLHVVHAVGGKAEVTAALEAQPLDAPLPFAEVARSGEPLYLDAASALERFPDWGAAMVSAGGAAAAIVPVWANGELRGVLGLTWPDAREFDEDEQAFVTTLGVMCAQAIMRAYLKSAEREARELAERANREKAQFVATVSHELRSPLSAVMNYTELLALELEAPDLAPQLSRVRRMRASGAHLLALLDELLGHARVEIAREIVKPEETELQRIVRESLEVVMPLAEARGLTIHVDMPDDPIPVVSDPLKLRQILVNVVANAVRHASHGHVHVTAARSGPGEVSVLLTVKDDGSGVAAEDRESIFLPFWQKLAKASVPGAGSSTGLGLSVARELARLLGGELLLAEGVQSSTFVLSLPQRYTAPTPVAA
jgi:signal transduction histidine kinase